MNEKHEKHERMAAAIGAMLMAFPSSNSNISQGTVSAYLMAVEDYDVEAVVIACKGFIKGTVPGHEGDFAPSAPKLAAEVRRCRDLLIQSANPSPQYISYKAGEKPPPGYVSLGEYDENARAHQMQKLLGEDK